MTPGQPPNPLGRGRRCACRRGFLPGVTLGVSALLVITPALAQWPPPRPTAAPDAATPLSAEGARGAEPPPAPVPRARPPEAAAPPGAAPPPKASPEPPRTWRPVMPLGRVPQLDGMKLSKGLPRVPPLFDARAWLRERYLAETTSGYRRMRRNGLIVLAVGAALAVTFSVCLAVGQVRPKQLTYDEFSYQPWWIVEAYRESRKGYERLAWTGAIGLPLSFLGLVLPGGSLAIHGHRRLKGPPAWLERFNPPEVPFWGEGSGSAGGLPEAPGNGVSLGGIGGTF